MDIFGLSLGQILGLFFVGYLLLNFLFFCIEGFFQFLSWGFHKLLAKLAAAAPAAPAVTDGENNEPD